MGFINRWKGADADALARRLIAALRNSINDQLHPVSGYSR
jgi:hypothetical protein